MIWRLYFKEYFTEIMNNCSMNLKNLNKNILRDIAVQIEDGQIEGLNERKDKLISSIYKAKADILLEENLLYWCFNCKKLMTKEQSNKVNCPTSANETHQYIKI